MQRLRLDVREVQAAPFLLPLRDDAWVAGEWDGHLLLRRSLSDAAVHPLPEQGLAEVPQGCDCSGWASDRRGAPQPQSGPRRWTKRCAGAGLPVRGDWR
ncbi:hypothetical protein P4234_12450 [Pseudomonas aeruginosa]|nr:hypothetical protein [Pseudomonas aeruginosa]